MFIHLKGLQYLLYLVLLPVYTKIPNNRYFLFNAFISLVGHSQGHRLTCKRLVEMRRGISLIKPCRNFRLNYNMQIIRQSNFSTSSLNCLVFSACSSSPLASLRLNSLASRQEYTKKKHEMFSNKRSIFCIIIPITLSFSPGK